MDSNRSDQSFGGGGIGSVFSLSTQVQAGKSFVRNHISTYRLESVGELKVFVEAGRVHHCAPRLLHGLRARGVRGGLSTRHALC